MAISTAIPQSAKARAVGIETIFKNLQGSISFLPQRVALVGQGNSAATYALTKQQVFSSFEVGSTYGFGSPLHLAAQQLLPASGDGIGIVPLTVYPLEDTGTGDPSAGDITPVGTPNASGSFIIYINGIPSAAFSVADSDAVATITAAMTTALAGNVDLPMTAVDGTTVVDLTSKWEGTSANDLVISVEGPTDINLAFTITQPVGGTVNPDVDDALVQVGSVWETMFLNCMDVADTVTLDKFSAFGEGRYDPLVKKPCVVFTGDTTVSVTSAIAIPDARGTDRTNSQLVAPGSINLPFVVAARELARIAALANSNPPTDYGSRIADGITPGTDAEQWDYLEKNTAINAGCSSVNVVDSVVKLADTVTFYHPAGDPTPAYQYVVDIVKLQNILYNTDLLFNNPEWDGAPLVPDNQPLVKNANAKQPKMAVAAVAGMIDSLAAEAIISEPDAAKATVIAEINGSNPKRLDITFTVQLSGNADIISIDLNFGFYFGGSIS